MKLPESLTLTPIYSAPSSWWEHVPIAHWLVENLKPEKIVELGTHYGVSFFSFCEAAEKYSPNTFVYAIDTWAGDEHAGHYDNHVYDTVKTYSVKYHSQRSSMIRSSFEYAEKYFSKNSVDIIHIDGLHTYEAVNNDFKTWLPKLKDGGSIILHDWNVRERDFGVWKLWEEIKKDQKFYCIETPNGHGLAIATLASQKPEWHNELEEILPVLVTKGGMLSEMARSRQEQRLLNKRIEESEAHSRNLDNIIITRDRHIGNLEKNIYNLEKDIYALKVEISKKPTLKSVINKVASKLKRLFKIR